MERNKKNNVNYPNVYNSHKISNNSQIEDNIVNNIDNCSQNNCKFSHKITIKT